MTTLDRSRPFGELIGSHSTVKNARYEQDGVWFDNAGVLCPGQRAPEIPEPVIEDPDNEAAVEGKILEMYKEGRTPVEISRETGVHFNSIRGMLRRAGL